MKNQDKKLLLECLKAMLPYNVECLIKSDSHKEIRQLKGIRIDNDGEIVYNFGKKYIFHNYLPLDLYSSEVKVCLRPISTISEEEIMELNEYVGATIKFDLRDGLHIPHICENTIYNWQKVIKWLNIKHFDTFGAVERGIAIEFISDIIGNNRKYFENGMLIKF